MFVIHVMAHLKIVSCLLLLNIHFPEASIHFKLTGMEHNSVPHREMRYSWLALSRNEKVRKPSCSCG